MPIHQLSSYTYMLKFFHILPLVLCTFCTCMYIEDETIFTIVAKVNLLTA